MKTYVLEVSFYTAEWDADSIADLLEGCRIVLHHAQNAAEYRDFSAEDVQVELIEKFGWPDGWGVTIDKIGDDGSPTLNVTAHIPEDRLADIQETLTTEADNQHLTLSYEPIVELVEEPWVAEWREKGDEKMPCPRCKHSVKTEGDLTHCVYCQWIAYNHAAKEVAV